MKRPRLAMLLELSLIVLWVSSLSSGTLNDERRYFAFVAENVSLPCHTASDHAVDWTFVSGQAGDESHICFDGMVTTHLRDKYRIESINSGDFNLVVLNVQREDTGQYRCIENAGMGPVHTLNLDVYDTSEIHHAPKLHSSEVPVNTTVVSGEETFAQLSGSTNLYAYMTILITILAIVLMAVVAVVVVRRYMRGWRASSYRHDGDEIQLLLRGVVANNNNQGNQGDQAGVSFLNGTVFYTAPYGSTILYVSCSTIERISKYFIMCGSVCLDESPIYQKPNQTNIVDMAANYNSNKLYLVDYNVRIMTFKPHDKSKPMNTVIDECGAKSVSITHDGNVLVGTLCQTLVEYTVDEWAAKVSLKEKVTLPDNMIVSHAVKTKRNTYIVAHTGPRGHTHGDAYSFTEDTLNDGVSEVDSHGYVIRQFGGPRGGGNDRVNRPSHLAMDEYGRIFVADTGNKRVLILSDQLEFHSELFRFEEEPRRLSYVHKTTQLIVGFAGGKICMYDVGDNESWVCGKCFQLEIG